MGVMLAVVINPVQCCIASSVCWCYVFAQASFCLEDTDCHSIPGGRHYYSCAEHRQGISLRCADVYGRDLDCQWIDITDVPDGVYVLRVSATSLNQPLRWGNYLSSWSHQSVQFNSPIKLAGCLSIALNDGC